MKPIVAIEGISFTGKTTLSNKLASLGFVRIYELAEKFGYGADFPGFSRTNEEAKVSDEWFVKQEIIRAKEAKQQAQNNPVITDRSFISGLNYAFAREKVFGIGNITYQHDNIKRCTKTDELYVPWHVYLRMDLSTYLARKSKDTERRIFEFGQKAVDNVTIFEQEEDFVLAQIEHYESVFAQTSTSCLQLDANSETGDLVRLVQDWISQLPAAIPLVCIENLFILPGGKKYHD